MRYVTNLASIDPVVSGIGYYTFRSNSIFDPDLTGVGHQPYGHDTLETVYNTYRVLSSKITVQFYASATGGIHSGVASIQSSTDNLPETNPNTALEQPATTYGPIASLESNKGVTKLTKTFVSSKMFGRDKRDDTSATFGVSPIEKSYFHIGVQSAQNGTDLPRVDLYVTITYKVLLTDPIALTGS